MIFVGIDDTDTLESPGTNQLARALVAGVGEEWPCLRITRHQLLDDPRVPCTSKNGSASIVLAPAEESDPGRLAERLREHMRERFVPGSDPGLCVAPQVPRAVVEFGRCCQRELVEAAEAHRLAEQSAIHLEGLGGTRGGVIGALAAVGLAASEDDGRVVQIGRWPDDLSGPQSIATVRARGVHVCRLDSGKPVTAGTVDLGKRLRPNYRGGRVVLFVEPAGEASAWRAVRLT